MYQCFLSEHLPGEELQIVGRLYQFRIIRICSNDNAAWISDYRTVLWIHEEIPD